MRLAFFATGLLLAACSSGGSQGDSCDPKCTAAIHFDGKAGIPLGDDPVTIKMCHGSTCLGVDVAVPATTATQSTGTDPSLTTTVELTTDPFYPDLQGVFHFVGTWSSSSEHIAKGDYVTFSVTAPDGGNVFMTGHTVAAAEVSGSCGCPTIELSH
jgi:hypothetical protein